MLKRDDEERLISGHLNPMEKVTTNRQGENVFTRNVTITGNFTIAKQLQKNSTTVVQQLLPTNLSAKFQTIRGKQHVQGC